MFSMFSKLLTRGFTFQFHFLLWKFNIAHFLFKYLEIRL